MEAREVLIGPIGHGKMSRRQLPKVLRRPIARFERNGRRAADKWWKEHEATHSVVNLLGWAKVGPICIMCKDANGEYLV